MKALAAVLALLPGLALAQIPAKLGYQGQLLKSDGTPEAGVVKFGFALYEAPTGGSTPVWSEEQNVGLTDGFYSVFLGEVTPLPAQIFDGDLFLEVQIGGVALSPRYRMGSVPFALAAGRVEGGAVNASSISVGGNQVIDSSGKLAGSAYTASTGSGLSVTGSGLTLSTDCQAGQLLKWSGTAWECSADGGNTYTAGDGLQLNGGAFSLKSGCAANQILKWSGSAWECAADGGNTYAAGDGLELKDGAFALLPGCKVGQAPIHDGSKWACSDVTSSPSMQAVAISNLLRNGDIEQWKADNSMAIFWSNYGSAATRTIGKVPGYYNASAIRVFDGDIGATAAIQQEVFASAPPSLAGELVTLTVWSKWSAGAASGKACIADAGPDEAETSITCVKLASAAGSSAWARTVVTHKVSASPSYLRVLLHPTTSAPEAGAYLFDGAMLVMGTYEGSFSTHITEQLYDAGIPSSKLAGIDVSAPLSGKGTPSAPLALGKATASSDGYLTAADWVTFNGKMATGSVTAPITGDGTAASPLKIAKANGSTDGYLAAADWTTFNGKMAANATASGDLTGSLPNPVVAKLQGRPVASSAPAVHQALTWNGSAWAPAFEAAVVSLSDAATISVDASAGNVFDVTLAGNRTMANPSNLVNGRQYTFRIKQDATGSRTLTWGTNYLFGATKEALASPANALNIFLFISDGTKLYAVGSYSTVPPCSPGSQTFNYSGTITTFTMPDNCTTLTIEAWGAQGGTGAGYSGGLGAYTKGTITTSGGTVYRVLVGQRGGDNGSYKAGGGGGGSFVTTAWNQPVMIAGGGGGGGGNSSASAGQAGQTGTSGGTISGSASGGTNGNGGASMGGSAGGAGLLTDGGASSCSNVPSAPRAFVNGGAGGAGGNCTAGGGYGGFGGGSGGEWCCHGAAGSGGGYSGGGGMSSTGPGGAGGGSYNGGSSQTNTSGANANASGNGKIVFTWSQ